MFVFIYLFLTLDFVLIFHALKVGLLLFAGQQVISQRWFGQFFYGNCFFFFFLISDARCYMF